MDNFGDQIIRFWNNLPAWLRIFLFFFAFGMIFRLTIYLIEGMGLGF